ncbi:MAG: molybdopterin oxidoreductase family protein [Nitrospiria bacterium]
MLFGRRTKNEIHLPVKAVDKWVYTTCGYCSTGCSLEVGLDKNGKAVTTRGVENADVNRGKLCLKGIYEFELFESQNRGTRPLIRASLSDTFTESSWDATLNKTASEIQRIQARYGRDSFAIVSTGQIYTEEFYTLGKLVRGVIGTNNYDGNTTLCMASAVSGYKRSFGSDGPPGCYDDFEQTNCLLAIGSNLPEQHPIIYYRLKEAYDRRHFPIIVVDPRVTMFAQMADIHLPIKPGTDLVLLNALAHVILAEGLEDQTYIAARTNGFDAFKKLIDQYDPETAEKICGISAEMIRKVARLYGEAGAAMTIWTMGINQSTHGSDGVVAINNLNLITGNIGRPGGTALSITGQCNAMGTREFSSCSGLPGYRLLEREEDRHFMSEFWGVEPSFFPQKRGLTETDIFPAIERGEIKGLWLIATNPMTSMPDTMRIRKAFQQLEFLVVQDAYADVETTEYAHVFIPAALWGEKEGVFTNTERRVNLVRKVMSPPGAAKSDLWIFKEMAKRFERGRRMRFAETPAEAFEEIKALSKGRLCDYSGMSHDQIESQRGIQWPCHSDKPEGSRRLYEDGRFQHADGKAKLIPLPFVDNNERPDEDYPFWLNTGRLVEQWHTRTKTGKIGNLNKFSPTPFMEMNPRAAERLGIAAMDYVRVSSRRASTVVLVQLTERVAVDTVFIPMHYYNCVNRLALGLLDPYSRQPAYKQSAVRIDRLADQEMAALENVAAREY